MPRHVCWLAQQAAEKALKAILVFVQLDSPRSHDEEDARSALDQARQVWRTVLADLAERDVSIGE